MTLDHYKTLRQTERILRAAGALLLEAHAKPRDIHFKGEVNLVTETDFAAEKLVVTQLRQLYPEHAIIAEEGTDLAGTHHAYTWVLDPLDGTNNFAHAFPMFCVNLALMDAEGPLLGATYDPLRNEMFTTIRGEGAYLNDSRIAVSPITVLQQGLLSTGFPYNRTEEGVDDNTDAVKLFIKRAQGLRRGGSAALDMAYVACGRLDGHWERGLNMWDVAVGVLLVREAGGTVSDYFGNQGKEMIHNDTQMVFSNGHLHQSMLDILARLYKP